MTVAVSVSATLQVGRLIVRMETRMSLVPAKTDLQLFLVLALAFSLHSVLIVTMEGFDFLCFSHGESFEVIQEVLQNILMCFNHYQSYNIEQWFSSDNTAHLWQSCCKQQPVPSQNFAKWVKDKGQDYQVNNFSTEWKVLLHLMHICCT